MNFPVRTNQTAPMGAPRSAANPEVAIPGWILSTDVDYVIDNVSGDDASGGTALAPWRSVARFFTQLNQYSRIESTARLLFVNTGVVYTMASANLPSLGVAGRVVFLGVDPTTTAEVVLAGSTTINVIVTNSSGELDHARRGKFIQWTTGVNTGARKVIVDSDATTIAGQVQMAMPIATKFAVAAGDNVVVGSYPVQLQWTTGQVVTCDSIIAPNALLGAGARLSRGLFFSKLDMLGSPAFAACGVVGLNGVGIAATATTLLVDVGATVYMGQITSSDLTFLGGPVDASLCNGWGVGSVAASGASQSVTCTGGVLQNAFLVVPGFSVSAFGASATVQGGNMYGRAVQPAMQCSAGAKLRVVGVLATATRITNFAGQLALSVVNQGQCDLNVAAFIGCTSTLCTVNSNGWLSSNSGANVTGASVGGYSIDATNGGIVSLNAQPTATGSLGDNKTDATISANATLAASGAYLTDPLKPGFSKIYRN